MTEASIIYLLIFVQFCFIGVAGYAWIKFNDSKSTHERLMMELIEELKCEVFKLRLRNKRLSALLMKYKAHADMRSMVDRIERSAMKAHT